MSPRVLNHRRVSCATCPQPCQLHLEGKIDLADPSVSCPVRRFSAWHDDAPTTSPPTFKLATVTPQSPSLLSKIKNFTMSFLRWREAGFPKRSREEIAACLSKCHSCPMWRSKGNFGFGECVHPKCGCTSFKPGWKTEHCPIGLW